MTLNHLSWIVPVLLCATCRAADEPADGAAELRIRALETITEAVSLHVEAQLEATKDGVLYKTSWSLEVRKLRGQPWHSQLREEVRDSESYIVRVPGKTYTETESDKLLLIENGRPPDFFASVNQILGFFEAIQPNREEKRERLPDVILNGEECAVFRRNGVMAHHAKADGFPRLVEWKDLTLRIQRVAFNTPIDPTRFEFQPPDGTRIEKQPPFESDTYAQKPEKGQRGWKPSTEKVVPPAKVVRLIEDF